MTKVLPIVMIVLSVAAAVVYGFAGDYRLMVYWASAAVLNASVTF